MRDANQELARSIQMWIDNHDGQDIVVSVAKLHCDPKDVQAIPSNIEDVKSVWSVDLSGTRVADISLLARFTDIRELFLNFIPITELSAIASFKRLEVLTLRDVPLTDLSFIRGMKSLKSLDLSGTEITDVSTLASCKKLVEVNLNETAVSDLSPLSALTKLQRVNLDGTRIKSLAPLTGLKSLSELSVSRTNIDSLEPLSNLTKLKRLRIDRTRVCCLSPLADAIKMTDLSANHCTIEDLTPLVGMPKLSCVYLGSTQVSDISPIAGNKLRDLYLDGSQLADLMPIKGNRSIPRIDIWRTGLSFRDTPIAKQDPGGFGAISEMENAYARSDALYRYLRKIKSWPLKKPLPPLALEPLPAPPKQAEWPLLERIKEDLLELESALVTDDAFYETYFDRLVALAEGVCDDARSFKGGDRDDLFWLSHNFANKFSHREKNLNWRFLEEHRLRLSVAVEAASLADKGMHQAFLNSAPKLLCLLAESSERNPSKHRMQHLCDPMDVEPSRVTDQHQRILAAFDSDHHYLFQWEARNLAKSLLSVNLRANWAPQVADALCRNAIVMIGTYANTYMARGAMKTDKSEAALLWLDANHDSVAEFSRTQGDDFANWIKATLRNTAAWIKAGKPLCNPTSDEQRKWHDIRNVEDRVWCENYH